jgi:hypothetical protein
MEPVLPLTHPLTLFHVALSLVAILAGLVVLRGLLASNPIPRWTHAFLWTTVATTLTGFLFPFKGVTPAFGTGVVSTIVLVPTLFAIYGRKLTGAWRKVFVIGAMISLYLNVFVLVAQTFLKVPAVHALAPTQAEPPFAIAQGVVLLVFVVLTIVAVRRARVVR